LLSNFSFSHVHKDHVFFSFLHENEKSTVVLEGFSELFGENVVALQAAEK
jgi:hypothetical protein